jgi:tellurite resistance protein
LHYHTVGAAACPGRAATDVGGEHLGVRSSLPAMSLDQLDQKERLRLMRFVCSFVWADLQVRDKEREFVRKMARKLKLADDLEQIERWLTVPPRAEEVDPGEIPREHRQLFLDAARAAIAADGEIDPEERETLSLFEQLVR